MSHDDEGIVNGMDRRDFLGKIAVGSMVGAGAMVFGGILILPLPKVLNEPPSIFKIGPPSDFPVNTFKLIAERSVFIFRESNSFRALSGLCTHLGCIVKRTDWGFQCPCHGSRFDDRGRVIFGPAPKALEWLKISMGHDGQLVVDLNTKVQETDLYTV